MSKTAETEISPAAKETLGVLITSLADNKAAMGRRYGEWAVSAPTLESGVAAAAMAQDELGHARSTYPLLKQLGQTLDDADGMDRGGALPLLSEPLPDWETFIAVNLVLDRMLTAFVEAARDSEFVQLAQRARKILQEERSHEIHADAWARRLAASNDRDAFSTAVGLVWEQAAGWPGDDGDYALLVSEGIVTGSPGELRETVRVAVSGAVAQTALTLTLK